MAACLYTEDDLRAKKLRKQRKNRALQKTESPLCCTALWLSGRDDNIPSSPKNNQQPLLPDARIKNYVDWNYEKLLLIPIYFWKHLKDADIETEGSLDESAFVENLQFEKYQLVYHLFVTIGKKNFTKNVSTNKYLQIVFLRFLIYKTTVPEKLGENENLEKRWKLRHGN